MVNAQNPNIELLLLAVNQLGDLVDEMVFIGGCATCAWRIDTQAAAGTGIAFGNESANGSYSMWFTVRDCLQLNQPA